MLVEVTGWQTVTTSEAEATGVNRKYTGALESTTIVATSLFIFSNSN
jgi:hypothetical protein